MTPSTPGTVTVEIRADTRRAREAVEEIELRAEVLNARTDAERVAAETKLLRLYQRRTLESTERLIELLPNWHPRNWWERLDFWRRRRRYMQDA